MCCVSLWVLEQTPWPPPGLVPEVLECRCTFWVEIRGGGTWGWEDE
jgi:hypothetical protein